MIVIYNNGNVVNQEAISIQDIPEGQKFGMLSSLMGPKKAQYDIPEIGLKEGEEYMYRVVLATYIRTANGYSTVSADREYPAKVYYDGIIL